MYIYVYELCKKRKILMTIIKRNYILSYAVVFIINEYKTSLSHSRFIIRSMIFILYIDINKTENQVQV